MKRLIPMALFCLMLGACTNEKKEQNQAQTNLKENPLIGTWANVTLLVTMKRMKKNDSLLQANEGEWEEVLKIKPIETTFNSDSTFASQYFTLDGQNFNTTLGKWWIENDSLVMESENGITKYDYRIQGNRVRFRATLDWDGDGEVDDSYDGVQVRID
ncbi:hypothetical protein [Reichenbachiella ulvae]|uniref:Lipocalin-like domain-containing protein n=1 Tax=Reichenbachiella ulvae TaxID=2980104 RepID=A0ABT3CYM7_9BACT|nr:hypothetical protein [Reichenbachiella ulvae]MCV9388318.1 hypothetical protein [Reichenbachiella ulvae]